MTNTNIAAKVLKKEKATDSAKSGVDSISRGSILIMGSISALIGVWAVACFIGAAMGGNLISVVGGWFRAIFGM